MLLAPDWQLQSYCPCKEDVKRLAEAPPSVVLLGCRRAKKPRVDYLAVLTARLPALSIIMYAASPDGDQILSDVSAGARGYVLKTAPPQELVRVIREVLSGRESFCEQAHETLVEFPRAILSLCQRAGLKPQACEIALLLLRHAEKRDCPAAWHADQHRLCACQAGFRRITRPPPERIGWGAGSTAVKGILPAAGFLRGHTLFHSFAPVPILGTRHWRSLA